MQRDVLHYDILIVGAGPAGLSAAIRLKQQNPTVCVVVVEKSASLGGHAVAGTVLEPTYLNQLLPHWRQHRGFTFTPVLSDKLYFLTRTQAIPLPTPPPMHNKGNGIISLPEFVRYLGAQAQALGVEIFTGFAAQSALIENNTVVGVVMGDFGLDPNAELTTQFTPGPEIRAKVTLFSEGCRGHITKQLVQQFGLQGTSPQTYALGLREVWQVKPEHHRVGEALHTLGAPLPRSIYGGGFVYHMPDGLVSLGFVSGLDYADPQFSPHEAFQAFKQHPHIARMLEGATRINAGARALYEGGLQGMYTPVLPGALLLGDAAGTLNVAKIKGIHTAMASGMIAADTVHQHLTAQKPLADFIPNMRHTPLWNELHRVRNIRPGFKHGLWLGLANAGLETLTRGLTPWTLPHGADHASLGSGAETITQDKQHPTYTDRLTGVDLGGQIHRDAQPNHLQILQPDLCATRCAEEYGNPCTKFCPAGVYEILDLDKGAPRLQINSSHCIHCKTCDIKDPYQIINWVAPEGGSGPNHSQ